MKHVLTLAAILTALACAPVMADTAQQNRMKDCNTQAKGKAGDERKTFMSTCLKGEAPAAAPAAAPVKADKMPAPEMSKSGKPLTAQQQKMKDCNAEAKGKKGDERKKFMSSCLKASPAKK